METIGGQDDLCRGGADGVRAALKYGQALALFSCGFEAARGGVYAEAGQDYEGQLPSLV